MELLKNKCNYNFDETVENKHVIIILMKHLKKHKTCNYNFDEHFEKTM